MTKHSGDSGLSTDKKTVKRKMLGILRSISLNIRGDSGLSANKKTQKRKFSCEVCEKSVEHTGNLKKHMTAFWGETL